MVKVVYWGFARPICTPSIYNYSNNVRLAVLVNYNTLKEVSLLGVAFAVQQNQAVLEIPLSCLV